MKNFDAALHFTILYSALVAFSFFCGAFKQMPSERKKRYLFVVFLALGIIMAFRSITVGNDTDSYVSMFRRALAYSNPIDAINASSSEAGYVLYSWILGQIYPNARILFVVTATIVCWSLGAFIYKNCEIPGLFCCLVVGLLMFDFFLSIIRQALAMAFLLFAFNAMMEKKVVKYYLLVIIAILFHNAVIVFLLLYPVYWFVENQGKLKYGFIGIMAFLVFVFSYYFNAFVRLAIRLMPKYQYYLNAITLNGQPRLAVILNIAVYTLLFAAPRFIRGRREPQSRMESLATFFAGTNILFLFASVRAPLLTRIAQSMAPFCVLQFTNNVHKLSINNRKILTALTCIAFYAYGLIVVVLRTPEWQTTYPIDLSWLI